ncbi:MAG: hypothetical protein A2328_08535, partial [Bdellovibrionales bacterium RIFOXYB2_FULL_36_6]
TNDLYGRINEHKQGLLGGFTKKYSCHKLVYFEQSDHIESAIGREKQLKKWRREKKEQLIKNINPGWRDLSLDEEFL